MGLCIACDADLGRSDTCPSCGLPQASAVLELHQRMASAQSRYELLKGLFAVGLVLSMGMGLALGVMASPSRSIELTRQGVIEQLQNQEVPLDIARDMFMRQVDSRLHLGLRSWVPHSSGAVVFEMALPTAESPTPMWEAFTTEEKRMVVEAFAAAYTATLFQTGHPVNVATDGHPVIALRYEGGETLVALRDADGRVVIYPSPLVQ